MSAERRMPSLRSELRSGLKAVGETIRERKGEFTLSASAIVLDVGVTVVLSWGPHGVLKEQGLTHEDRIAQMSRSTDIPPSGTIVTRPGMPEAPPAPTPERSHAHEPILEKDVCDPLIKAVQDRLGTKKKTTTLTVKEPEPGETSGRSTYTLTRETETHRTTITTNAIGDKDHFDPATVLNILAAYEELHTAHVTSDNKEGNTGIAGVYCYKPIIEGQETTLEAYGIADSGAAEFNTIDPALTDPKIARSSDERDRLARIEAEKAARAARTILKSLQ